MNPALFCPPQTNIFTFREKIFCATQAPRPGFIACAASFETRAAGGTNSIS
jgi:hypothetical protein